MTLILKQLLRIRLVNTDAISVIFCLEFSTLQVTKLESNVAQIDEKHADHIDLVSKGTSGK